MNVVPRSLPLVVAFAVGAAAGTPASTEVCSTMGGPRVHCCCAEPRGEVAPRLGCCHAVERLVNAADLSGHERALAPPPVASRLHMTWAEAEGGGHVTDITIISRADVGRLLCMRI